VLFRSLDATDTNTAGLLVLRCLKSPDTRETHVLMVVEPRPRRFFNMKAGGDYTARN
jgi:hypothetical protein